LLEAKKGVSQQTASKPKSGPQGGRPTGIPRQIADETGLSVDTVRRALNPPAPRAEPPKEVFDVHEQARRRSAAITTSFSRRRTQSSPRE